MKNVFVGVVIGVVVAYLGVYFTGFAAAIAVPEVVAEILSGRGFVVWEIVVTQFLGYGVIVFLLVFFSVRSLRLNPYVAALAAVLSCEAVLFGTHTSQYIFYMPHLIVLIFCAVLAAFLAIRQGNV